MSNNSKIGIVWDEDFGTKHVPPFPHPTFLSYEDPSRIQVILNYLNSIGFFDKPQILKLTPKVIDDDVLKLTHSKYHIESIKRLSKFGSGLIGEEVYITQDTYELAKKAVGGTIEALERVLSGEVNQSFALIRPPGHHALRDQAAGLCIFNNIAIAIHYLRKILNYQKNIAIIDIDLHFGDGLSRIFYEDPTVLYCSTHEFDFVEGDLGDINELGAGEGLGKNINFPVPEGIGDDVFLEFMSVVEPILLEYKPDLIIIAAGFDMYYADPIGNCCLTSQAYNKFSERVLNLAQKVCGGKLAFVLEGGYSIIGLPYCVHAILSGLLNEPFESPQFESFYVPPQSKREDVLKVKNTLKNKLKPYWRSIK